LKKNAFLCRQITTNNYKRTQTKVGNFGVKNKRNETITFPNKLKKQLMNLKYALKQKVVSQKTEFEHWKI